MRAEDILPDETDLVEHNGIMIRKGTVGAFLANAKIWSDPTSNAVQRAAVERDIFDAVPALQALGLFDVFTIRDTALSELIKKH